MPPLWDRLRNVLRNEMVIPTPAKTAQELETDSQRVQAKIDEGYRMGASAAITHVAEYLLDRQAAQQNSWASRLAVSPATFHEKINGGFTEVLLEQNTLIRDITRYTRHNGLNPDTLPDQVIPNHAKALAYEQSAVVAEQSAQQKQENLSYEEMYGFEGRGEQSEYSRGMEAQRQSEQSMDKIESKKTLGLLHEEMTEFLGSPDLAQEFVIQMKSAYPDLSPSQMLADSRYITSISDPEQLEFELIRPSGLLVDLRTFSPLLSTETQSHSAEVSANRYEYLDLAVQQLSRSTSPSVAREISQPLAISQPQQSVFFQPERAQQLAMETPEVQRDFGVSL